MDLKMASNNAPVTSFKIHVDNDFQAKESSSLEQNTSANYFDEEMEEGEASEDEVEVNVIVSKPIDENYQYVEGKPSGQEYKSYSRSNNLHRKKNEFEDYDLPDFEFPDSAIDERLEERASRFGISSSEHYIPRNDLLKLYKSLEIDEDDFNRGGWRSDALHMRGIEGMKKQYIFDYFKKYSPTNIEWLTNDSCNVVWMEKNGAARALLGLSCPIKHSIKKNTSENKRRKSPELSKASNSRNHRPLVQPKTKSSQQRQITSKKEKGKTVKSKSSSEKSESSSSGESSSDSSDSEGEKDDDGKSSGSSSSDSDGSSSSNSSDDDSTSSSESDSSSDDSSSDDEETSTMDVDESSNKTKSKVSSTQPLPLPKESFKITVDNPKTDSPQSFKEDGSISADEIGVPVPPGKWRLGVPSPFVKAIFLRFAHCKDKKVPYLPKPVEVNSKYTRSNRRSPPIRQSSPRKLLKAPEYYNPDEVYDKNQRVPPLHSSRRTPDHHYAPPDDRKRYHDLDDPFGHNPWGFLAENWGKRETQDSLDYQALLKDHIIGKGQKRKPDFSESEEEDYQEAHRQKRFRLGSRIGLREPDYSRVSSPPIEDYHEEEYEGKLSDGSDDVVAWKSKITLPRMRMYADAEEKKKVKRKKKVLHDRIGSKPRIKSFVRSSSEQFPQKSFDLRHKLQRSKKSRDFRGSYSESD